MSELAELCFPPARAGEALATLAAAAGLGPRALEPGQPGGDLAPWLEEAARHLGVEVESLEAPFPDVERLVTGSAPALVELENGGLLAVLEAGRRHATIITPRGEHARVASRALAAALRAPLALELAPELGALADRAGLQGARRARVLQALTATRLRFVAVGGVFALRPGAESPLSVQAGRLGLVARFAASAAVHALAYGLGLCAWWALGRGALSARLDGGWLAAFGAFVVSASLLRALGLWWMGGIAIDSGLLLKQRMLLGALRIPRDVLRAEGIGAALGRAYEAAAVERLGTTGSFLALFAGIELLGASFVLGAGAGGALHVALLAVTLAATAWLSHRYLKRRRAYTSSRLTLTHALVETMAGHATRLAQEPAAERHLAEDRALGHHAALGARMDRTLAALQVVVPRGWLLGAVAALTPALVVGAAPAQLAVALGGILLAYSSLQTLAAGVTRLVDLAIAWRAVAPLVEAGEQAPIAASPAITLAPASPSAAVAALRGVVYRPPRRAAPVLDGCDLIIRRGESVLLEGASGAGKSTLGALLAGLRRPDAGLLLAGGLDRGLLGESGWRRRVACAPQFHDNHMFSAPLAFNLLVGRGWPPRAADLRDARRLCGELGLGPLLERMPAGLFEMVGETGWQLSHGEKSRIYLARALLQGAPLVVLDESLAALDPETLEQALGCIRRWAEATLIIAHP